MVSKGRLLIDHNTPKTAGKENLWFYSSLSFVSDKLPQTTRNPLYAGENLKLSTCSCIPWGHTAESIHSFDLERNKGSFCANITFPHEHKQSQTSAHDDSITVRGCQQQALPWVVGGDLHTIHLAPWITAEAGSFSEILPGSTITLATLFNLINAITTSVCSEQPGRAKWHKEEVNWANPCHTGLISFPSRFSPRLGELFPMCKVFNVIYTAPPHTHTHCWRLIGRTKPRW